MDILAAIDDVNLLGASLRNAESWKPWRALLAGSFGLPLEIPIRPSFSASARAGRRRLARLQAIFGL
jgi:hypothetical protein